MGAQLNCPKCGYTRQANETVPEWQCPACGIAYRKYQAEESQLHQPANPASSKHVHGSQVNKQTGFSFKKVRIILLLLLLAGVALDSWLTMQRTTDWDHSLWVVVYPINAEGSQAVDDYITALVESDFASIESYFREEVDRYGVAVNNPVEVRLGPVLSERPPLPPENSDRLGVMLWSLKLRYWSIVNDHYDGPQPDIKVFALYYTPEENKRLAHSTGLQKGMVSIVHAFAHKKLASRNNVVMAHEMLHTLGASDKYDLLSGLPVYPHGYAEPQREPLFPQRFAELMGAYIPLSESEVEMPASLAKTLVGVQTAREIGWLKPD